MIFVLTFCGLCESSTNLHYVLILLMIFTSMSISGDVYYLQIQALTERVISQGKKYEEISLKEEEKQFVHELQKRNLESHKESVEESRLNLDDDKRGQQKIVEKLYTGIQNLVDITKAEVSPLLLLLGKYLLFSQNELNIKGMLLLVQFLVLH